MRRFLPMLRVLSLCLLTSQCSFDLTAQDKPASKLALPATDDGLAGTVPFAVMTGFKTTGSVAVRSSQLMQPTRRTQSSFSAIR